MYYLEVFYARLARRIHQHPFIFLFTPILTTIVLTAGLHRFKQQNDPLELLSPGHSKLTLVRIESIDK